MSTGPHLLIVEDERAIREPLARLLARDGFRITAVEHAAAARAAMAAGHFDLAILDIMMPGEDGLSLARSIRASSPLPIILLTARAEDIDRIIGLEIGADDYMAKPFNPRELTARIRAVLRRTGLASLSGDEADKPSGYRFGNWFLDTRARLLRRGEERAVLTEGEFQLLEVLVSRAGRVLSRDQLLDLTKHRSGQPFDRAVDNMILRLRKRIEPDPTRPGLIRTVYGAGYVFAGEVEKI